MTEELIAQEVLPDTSKRQRTPMNITTGTIVFIGFHPTNQTYLLMVELVINDIIGFHKDR